MVEGAVERLGDVDDWLGDGSPVGVVSEHATNAANSTTPPTSLTLSTVSRRTERGAKDLQLDR